MSVVSMWPYVEQAAKAAADKVVTNIPASKR
jgi:hypothetical protein